MENYRISTIEQIGGVMDKVIMTEDIFFKAAERFAERIDHPKEITWLDDTRDGLVMLHERIMALKDVGAL